MYSGPFARPLARALALSVIVLAPACSTVADADDSYDIGSLGSFPDLHEARQRLATKPDLTILVRSAEIVVDDRVANTIAGHTADGKFDTAALERMQERLPRMITSDLSNLEGITLPGDDGGSLVFEAHGEITGANLATETHEAEGGDEERYLGEMEHTRIVINAYTEVRAFAEDGRLLATGTVHAERSIPLEKHSSITEAGGPHGGRTSTKHSLDPGAVAGLIENAFLAATYDAVQRLRTAPGGTP